jgi:hypothetical protein
MRSPRALVAGLAIASVAIGLAPTPAAAADAVSVVQESRTRQPGKKRSSVVHVALLKNTSIHGIRGLRVTVELHDSFGKLLWSRTVTPGPASLRPGEIASLSVTTPDLDAYKKTVYRFDYRADPNRR